MEPQDEAKGEHHYGYRYWFQRQHIEAKGLQVGRQHAAEILDMSEATEEHFELLEIDVLGQWQESLALLCDLADWSPAAIIKSDGKRAKIGSFQKLLQMFGIEFERAIQSSTIGGLIKGRAKVSQIWVSKQVFLSNSYLDEFQAALQVRSGKREDGVEVAPLAGIQHDLGGSLGEVLRNLAGLLVPPFPPVPPLTILRAVLD